jgi:hypothetical protein
MEAAVVLEQARALEDEDPLERVVDRRCRQPGIDTFERGAQTPREDDFGEVVPLGRQLLGFDVRAKGDLVADSEDGRRVRHLAPTSEASLPECTPTGGGIPFPGLPAGFSLAWPGRAKVYDCGRRVYDQKRGSRDSWDHDRRVAR